MATSMVQLDFRATGSGLSASLPSISSQRYRQNLIILLGRPEGGEIQPLSHLLSGQVGLPPEKLQEFLWQEFFSDRTQWFDYRRSKRTPRHPDFRHKESKVALWLDNRHKPYWVDSQLATWDTRIKEPPAVESAFGRSASHQEHGMCKKLCEDGHIAEAVDALNFLVQRGSHLPSSLFYLVLQRCIARKDLVLGRRIHSLTVESGYEGDAFLATHIMGLYASHGRLEEALQVFAKVSTPDAYNWATIIFAYARHGQPRRAIELYGQMLESSVRPDNRIFLAVLKACACAGDLAAGKKVHAHILASTRKPDMFVQNALVDMYAKCGSLVDAQTVFNGLACKDMVTWTAMIAGYVQQGMGQEALTLYSSMLQEGTAPSSSVTFTCLLQACATVGVVALHQGKQLHAQIEEQGLQNDVVVGGGLVNMYAKCGSIEDARTVFDRLPERNVVTWTAMISGYVQQRMSQEALGLYSNMLKEGIAPPNSITFTCLLQACASAGSVALHEGKQLHAQIIARGLQNDVVVGGSLVNMYAKCGSIEDARAVFDELAHKNVVTWNVIIAGYAQQGICQEALSLYSSMQQEGITMPNLVTFTCLVQACASVGVAALHQGNILYSQIEERGLQGDVILGGTLVNMYARCGSIVDARRVFDRLQHKNLVTWTSMIAGYAQHGMGWEALSLYSTMRQEGIAPPDSVTFICLLQACASVGVVALDQGKQLHAEIKDRGLQDDVVIGGSLVNLYAKCSSIDDARRVFDRLTQRNLVTWNAMIAGYADQGMAQEALSLYSLMQQEGIIPDSVTFVGLLQACATVAALPLGKLLHGQIEERGLQADVVVGAGLVNMYAKCGSMVDSQQVFDSLPHRNVETWSALIAGYARLGDSEVVFDLLDRMTLEGTHPNAITLLSVLTVCSHVGLVDKGRKYFEAMTTDYGISQNIEHYTCMMDLLGRGGHLKEALQMAKSMPFPADGTMWVTLLGACRKWNNVEVGQQAFESAVSMDENDASVYVLMSNIYSGAQMWEQAKEMQARRKKLKAWKQPGQSWWTDIGGAVHTFVVADKKHPESEGIYARLEQLVPKMKKAGYVPHLSSSLQDIPDDEKEAELCGHSEKLAIAYALNKTPEGTAIRVVKNLRVCVDCHSAIAFISKIEKRTIICRDTNRFHVYKDGECSCGDYW